MRVNALVAKAQKTPEEGWTMQDGTPWPGNNPRDHPGMIQVRNRFTRTSNTTSSIYLFCITFCFNITRIHIFSGFPRTQWGP